MYTIGVDLGGTNIAVGIVNEAGIILTKGSVPTGSERGYEAVVEDMANLSLDLVKRAQLSVEDIQSVGIGCPGTIDSMEGTIVYSNNLNFTQAPIAKTFQAILHKPIYMANDANAAAYGEYISGAGEFYKDFVAITLGTGVGSGVIIDGKMIEGSYFGGGEMGHMVISAGGEACTCGRKGCWEVYSSATGLIRIAKAAALEHEDSMLNTMVSGNLDHMNAKIPFDCAQSGDVIAQDVVKQYIHYLAIGLVNVVNIFQPEVIVLGGGVSAQRENLIQPLIAAMASEVYGGASAFKTEIKVAELGNDAGIIGAAMLHKLHE